MQQNFEQARKNMIACQVRPNQVSDPALLAAMQNLPREKFLPLSLQNRAYADDNIDLGNGRCLPGPMVLARLLQAARIRSADAVLDVGCGTGYSAALLSSLCREVTAIEADGKMAEEGALLLRQLGVTNARIIQKTRLPAGCPEKAPFDVIVINGAVGAVPDSLKSQLAPGGRLVAVLCRQGRVGAAILVTRQGDSFATRSLFDAALPALPGFEDTKAFVF